MMNFNEFQNYISMTIKFCIDGVSDVMPHSTLKNNDTKKNGLFVKFDANKEIGIIIYLDDLYHLYVSSQKTIDNIIDTIENSILEAKEKIETNSLSMFSSLGEQYTDWEFVKGRLFTAVVNKDKNADLLKNVPHVDFEDLSLVFRVAVSDLNQTKPFNKIETILVKNEHMDFWSVTQNELLHTAIKNSIEKLPAKVMNMRELILDKMKTSGLLSDEDFEESILEMCTPDIPASEDSTASMYVISNNICIYGASAVFYPDVLQDIADKVGSDLYLLPSSIHEMIAIPVNTALSTPDELKNLVKEVNGAEVAPKEQLSDNVYLYSRETKEFHLV